MKKILLIEDDVNILKGLTIRIRNLGHMVFTAQDGYSGIKLARSKSPDLIIMDYGLPGGDGVTVANRMANISVLGAIPVIFLTANHDPAVHDRALESGAVAFFNKPYKPEELMDLITWTLGLSSEAA